MATKTNARLVFVTPIELNQSGALTGQSTDGGEQSSQVSRAGEYGLLDAVPVIKQGTISLAL